MTATQPASPVTGLIAPADAAARLARLGFLVVNGTHPAAPGGAQLLVAIRSTPTLEHFDPELVQFWSFEHGKGRIAELTPAVPLPFRRPFSWGTIRATDRLEVYNSFLTFGGDLEADRVGPNEFAIVFRSPAPIVRWTGHSQDVDPQAGALGAFFGRMMVPIGDVPGAEERVGALEPVALYAAFLSSVDARLGGSATLTHGNDDPAAVFVSEVHRVRVGWPAEWARGAALATELGLVG